MLQVLEQLAEENDQVPYVHLLLAVCYQELGELEAALEAGEWPHTPVCWLSCEGGGRGGEWKGEMLCFAAGCVCVSVRVLGVCARGRRMD